MRTSALLASSLPQLEVAAAIARRPPIGLHHVPKWHSAPRDRLARLLAAPPLPQAHWHSATSRLDGCMGAR